MTNDEITAALALAEAATPGEWGVERRDCDNLHDDAIDRSRVIMARDTFGGWHTQTGLVPTADAAFIAAARTGWPAALLALREARNMLMQSYKTKVEYQAERDAARAEVASLREVLGIIWKSCDPGEDFPSWVVDCVLNPPKENE